LISSVNPMAQKPFLFLSSFDKYLVKAIASQLHIFGNRSHFTLWRKRKRRRMSIL